MKKDHACPNLKKAFLNKMQNMQSCLYVYWTDIHHSVCTYKPPLCNNKEAKKQSKEALKQRKNIFSPRTHILTYPKPLAAHYWEQELILYLFTTQRFEYFPSIPAPPHPQYRSVGRLLLTRDLWLRLLAHNKVDIAVGLCASTFCLVKISEAVSLSGPGPARD